MSLLNDLFKGAIVLSILALAQHGFTVKDMANKAAKVHKKGRFSELLVVRTTKPGLSRALRNEDSARSAVRTAVLVENTQQQFFLK